MNHFDTVVDNARYLTMVKLNFKPEKQVLVVTSMQNEHCVTSSVFEL